MRKALLALALTGVFAITLSAQDDAAVYKGFMTSIQMNFGALRMATTADAAKGPAAALAGDFDKVASFWKAKNTADAVTFAETARDTAKAIAAGTGDLDANKMTIQGTCGGCHMAHRAGGRGSFTIK